MNRVKINTLCSLFFAILLSLLSASPVFPKQIMLDSTEQFDFAQDCMDNGQYDMAIGEFKRFIYFFPHDPHVKNARLLIGICHLKARRYDAAREVFSQIVESNPDSPLAGKALFLTGESYYEQGISNEAEYYLGLLAEQYPFPDLKNAAIYRLGWTKIQENKWRQASDIFGRMEKDSSFYDSSQELAKQSLRGEKLPLKSPALAGVLAAFIPGLGHAYVSRYEDAMVAFLLNGLFVWATAESFHEDHNVLGGILTFLEIGWYTGNIYSAVNVTYKYNRKLQNDFRSSLEDRLDLDKLSDNDMRIGLSLSFPF